ncbi:MAG: hypothetical protein JSW33_02500 [bacterium]|nr:MAG: hypothetical protein JSW33_02500 [bacterium]
MKTRTSPRLACTALPAARLVSDRQAGGQALRSFHSLRSELQMLTHSWTKRPGHLD